MAAYDHLMGSWWHNDIVAAGKLPMLLCLVAFVLTFLLTRTITRMIRAGRGPFRDNVSTSGVHVHHAVPGIILLVIGAVMAVQPSGTPWQEIAGVLVGVGTSLILDEFALILRLQDVYWQNEGRISVELIGLTAACLGLVMLGFSPFGVVDIDVDAFGLRLVFVSTLAIHGLFVLSCVFKGKYRAALIGCFIPIVGWVCGIRVGRPHSWWARHFYGPKRIAKASRRAEKFDRRWEPRWRWFGDLIAGSPTAPDPAPDRPEPAAAGPVAENCVPHPRDADQAAGP